MQGHERIIAHDFCVAHREANSGLSTLNRTKTILSIYHQQRQLQKQRGMCLNDTYPFCQQPLSGNCHSICFSKPVLWTATPGLSFLVRQGLEPIQSAVLWTAGKRRLDGVYTIVYSSPVARQGSLFLVRQDSNPFNQQSCGLLSLSKKPRRVWRRKPPNKIKFHIYNISATVQFSKKA